MFKHLFLLFLMFFSATIRLSAQQIPAFPGAEGFGRFAKGGRGGRVIHVTNLNDRGDGSLRAALEAKGPRIVVFDVSGNIELKSKIIVRNSFLTIAGQTAPGDGICIKDNCFYFHNCQDVIVRYLRFRMGDKYKIEDDALGGQKNLNMIIDHCSVSWSTDECASFYANENFTLQWCILSESLCRSFHHTGKKHGFGGIWGGKRASFHHNLLAHHTSRNPRLGEYPTSYPLSDLVDIRNNVIFNYGYNTSYGGEGMNANIVNNYYKPGPASKEFLKSRIIAIRKRVETWDASYKKFGHFYIDGNLLSDSKSATEDNWNCGVYNHLDTDHVTQQELISLRCSTPHKIEYTTTQSAEEAYEDVLKYVGASLHRDKVDKRIVREVKTGKVTYKRGGRGSVNGIIDTQETVGGWPELRSKSPLKDSDQDGMPDEWELKMGLDPLDETDGKGDRNHDGYTNIEEYINGLVNDNYNTRPSVNILNPKNNQRFISEDKVDVDLDCYASDYNKGKIASMKLYLDDKLLKEFKNQIHLEYSLKDISHGMHSITIKAIDNTGLETIKTSVFYVGSKEVRLNIDERARNGHVTLTPPGGIYTEGIKVNVKAVPNHNYHFYRWTKDLTLKNDELTIITDSDLCLKPVFLPNENQKDNYLKPIKVNFGSTNGFYSPDGYLSDGGCMYFTRLNGLTFGWLEGFNYSGKVDYSIKNKLKASCIQFETDSTNHSWGIQLPKGIYRVKLGLSAKKEQTFIKLNIGCNKYDHNERCLKDRITEDTYREYVLENVDIIDNPNHKPFADLVLSSPNQTRIHYIEIDPVRVSPMRHLTVINGLGSGSYYNVSEPILIEANPPAEGWEFYKWVSDSETQYFEELDKWMYINEYVEDIYSSTTFVTSIDYFTTIRATYREKK